MKLRLSRRRARQESERGAHIVQGEQCEEFGDQLQSRKEGHRGANSISNTFGLDKESKYSICQIRQPIAISLLCSLLCGGLKSG